MGFYVIAGIAGLVITSGLFILAYDVVTQCDYFKANRLKIEGGQRLTPEQIAELAAIMRRTEQCERARLPLQLEIEIDGETVIEIEAQPSGLWDDGHASVYERFDVAPGPHRITARLRDSAREDGWDYAYSEDVILEPGRYFTITFRPETGGFHYR